MDWKIPVQARYGHLFLEEMSIANIEKGPKPKAFDTPFRYSDAGKCSRALAYGVLGYEAEPMDLAGLLVTSLGTELHEKMQDAIANYFEASFEVPSQLGLASGSADGVIYDGEFKVLIEIKSMNGTAFKKSIGVNTRSQVNPAGPRASALIQGAMNAVANDCHVLRIIHVGTEAVSKGIAERWMIDEVGRVIAEFDVPREVFEPWANYEMVRHQEIIDGLNEGVLPDRIAIDDDMNDISLSPEGGRMAWQCQYCSYTSACIKDGPGNPPAVAVTITNKEYEHGTL